MRQGDLAHFLLLRSGFPDFPNLSDQIRSWTESCVSRFPTRGCDLASLSHMLESFYLAKQFVRIATHLRCKHFHGTDDKIGIDDESSPDIHSGRFIIHAVGSSDLSSPI